jgi:hypothetical protein
MMIWYYQLLHRYWHPVLEVPEGFCEMLRRAGWREFRFERVSR